MRLSKQLTTSSIIVVGVVRCKICQMAKSRQLYKTDLLRTYYRVCIR